MGTQACRGRARPCTVNHPGQWPRSATPGCWMEEARQQYREWGPYMDNTVRSGVRNKQSDHLLQSDVILLQSCNSAAVSFAHDVFATWGQLRLFQVQKSFEKNLKNILNIFNIVCSWLMSGRRSSVQTWPRRRPWRWCRDTRCREPTPRCPSARSAPRSPASLAALPPPPSASAPRTPHTGSETWARLHQRRTLEELRSFGTTGTSQVSLRQLQ